MRALNLAAGRPLTRPLGDHLVVARWLPVPHPFSILPLLLLLSSESGLSSFRNGGALGWRELPALSGPENRPPRALHAQGSTHTAGSIFGVGTFWPKTGGLKGFLFDLNKSNALEELEQLGLIEMERGGCGGRRG